jgi:hypothetical protein
MLKLGSFVLLETLGKISVADSSLINFSSPDKAFPQSYQSSTTELKEDLVQQQHLMHQIFPKQSHGGLGQY